MILLVSGLSLVNNINSFGLTLLSEWIIGMAGNSCVQEEAAHIVHVIIAGICDYFNLYQLVFICMIKINKYIYDCLGNSVRGFIETFDRKNYSKKRKYNEILTKETQVATYKLDEFLKPIVKCCCVTLMPGEFDPACHTLPQQPLHPCLLPQTIRYNIKYKIAKRMRNLFTLQKNLQI